MLPTQFRYSLLLQDNITLVLNQLKIALKQRISESDWLDQETRERATGKVNSIIDLLGYPDFITNDTLLDKFYASVSAREVYELSAAS